MRKLFSFFIVSLICLVACNGLAGQLPATLPLPTATVTLPPTSLPTSTMPLPTPSNLQPAVVAKVVDGDTAALTNGREVRYIGINTPEWGQPFYVEASAVNRQLVEGREIQLEFDVETFDQYGRTLAYLWSGGVLVNLEIVRQGFANAFTVPPNLRYQKFFQQAEREAREAKRGLWADAGIPLKIVHIEADAPGSDNANPNGEWVEIANQGSQAIQMKGFTLKDEANHIYTFRNFTLAAGSSFRLYSGQGQDSQSALYWGFVDKSVWNNDSDTAFLRDTQGALIDTFTY